MVIHNASVRNGSLRASWSRFPSQSSRFFKRIGWLGGLALAVVTAGAGSSWAADPAAKPPAKKPAGKGGGKKLPEWHGEAAPREIVPGEKVLVALMELGGQRMANGRYEEALKAFTDAAQRAPLEPKPLYLRGSCYQKMGKLGEAEADFRQALQLDPKAHDDQTIKVRAELGAVLTDQGRPAEAIDILEQAAQQKADMFEAQYNLGVAHEALKHWDQAIAAYTAATKLKPIDKNPRATQADAYYNLGAVLRKSGHLEEAIAPTREAVQLAPDKPHTHLSLALLLSDAKRYDEAVAELTAATQLADGQMKSGATAEEREEGKQLLYKAWWRLGIVHIKREAPNDAITALEQAKRIQATPEVLTDLGLALTKAKNNPRAEAEFRQALALNPKINVTRLQLATLLATTGRCPEGLRELGLVPNEPAFAETINRIRQRCDYEREMQNRALKK